MTHSHKRPKSRFEWFRMDVPARHRASVGKTSWQHSLETTDPDLAAIRRAKWTAHYKTEVKRLDELRAVDTVRKIEKFVNDALCVFAQIHGSWDRTVAHDLMHVAKFTETSWTLQRAYADVMEYLGDEPCPIAMARALPAFSDENHLAAFQLRANLIEGRGIADGLVYQEVARRLLERGEFDMVYPVVVNLGNVVEDKDGLIETHYEAVAAEYLRRLAAHEFTSWPEGIHEALAPLASPLATFVQNPLTVPPAPVQSGQGHGLLAVFADWRGKTKATIKAQDEFKTSIDRFVALFGDMAVEAISKAYVIDYRNVLQGLPARAKKDVAALDLRQQVELAMAERLPCLSPASVEKGMQALRTTLAHARDELLIIEVNPAAGVRVDKGAVHRDERLPFNGEQLRLIFSQPLMIDPDQHDDSMFWFLLLAPFTGCRIEEIAKLRPQNVRREDGIWYIAIERDRKRERDAAKSDGGIAKRTKTVSSVRNLPVHSILLKAGFIDLVGRARETSAEWLFDDLREYARYDQRGKYMSNKVMRFIRGAGIVEAEYVFHSFRHSLKGKLRDDEATKAEISDLLTGHSSASVGRSYARGAGLGTLKAAIDRVSYPSVNWTPVLAAGQIRADRRR